MKVQVTYKRVKRLSMRITQRGEVHVSAPFGIAKSEVEKFILSNKEWIEHALAQTQQRVEARQDFYAQLPCRTKAEKQVIEQKLNAIILPLICKYEVLMGVRCAGCKYKRTTSRWGSCNTRSREITFSYYLCLLPEWCIEHVVVHELAHLLVPNHSPKFHQIMDTYFPRWREARKYTTQLVNK